MVCVCAYGVLIKEPLLSAYPMINVHPSLLPRWRGAAESSGRSWPATRRLGFRSCGSPRTRLRRSVSPRSRADPPRRRLQDARLRLQRLGGELLVRRRAAAVHRAGRVAGRIRAQDRAADRALDPRRSFELERTVRASAAHRSTVALPEETSSGSSPRGVADAAAGPEPGRVRAEGRTAYSAQAAERSSSPGARPMAAADWLRGRPPERLADFVVPTPA